jgi:uncharacterized protein with HEPN domain
MRRDRATDLLQDILDFIDRIQSWTPSDLDPALGTDEKTLYAVLHALQHIGEAVSRLPTEVTDLAPEIPWASIRAMRNVIAHDYAGVDAAVVWKTVRQRLPELRAATETVLQRLTRSQS